MSDVVSENGNNSEKIIKEVIELERKYFFEKRNVNTERQRKLRELIERNTKAGETEIDS